MKIHATSRLLISFSGGETSALMTKLIHENWSARYDEIVTVFANTGQENEATLEFVRACTESFGWNVVWLEAVTNPVVGKGASAKVVGFDTADRTGSPFEAMIAKYGIPGPGFVHCTRELKERPITAYARSIGWAAGSYDTAIGIRIDEIDRMNPSARDKRLLYPLVRDFPHRKVDVNAFWAQQDFRLQLRGYQGNCRWCWKKSLRKHLTIMTETPEAFDFPARMEEAYPLAGANPRNEPKRFFRNRRTVADLRELAALGQFQPAEDDARTEAEPWMFSWQGELDTSGACSESCDVEFTESAP